MPSLSTVLLDLDGVVRHFDPSNIAALEARHGLAPGVLLTTAFEHPLIDQVVTGQISRAEWAGEVGRRVGHPDAAVEWMAQPARVDEAILVEVDALRSAGVTVAILTNGTDTIPEEMRQLGLDQRFDAIFNSADIGYAKPDKRVFQAACDGLAVEPTSVFFTDDSKSKLAGALELGMTARLFEGVETFRSHLAEAGFGLP